MGPYEQGTASKEPHPDSPTNLEESMLHLGLGDSEGLPAYPERPDAPDCAYYIRTGSCGYGISCRFNHPRDREAIANAQRARLVEHPERVGGQVCQYFLRTGTCKYGNFCKYNHPGQRGVSVLPVTLNIHGYPLRPGEKECSYYLRTGRCKFGATCKFHHPQASGITIPLPTPAFYSTVQPLAVPSYHQYPITRPSVLPAPYMQEPYGPIFLSPGLIPVPSWSPYPLTVQTGSFDGSSTQLSSAGPAHPGAHLRAASSTGPSGDCQIEQTSPEKPDQPEANIALGQEIADTVPHVNTLIP